MGLEGYFINQFIVVKINKWIDKWGGFYENCICFLIEIVCCIWEVVGLNFIIIYWLFMFDLVYDGSSWEEVEYFVWEIEVAGVIIINMGIGWYEAWVLMIVMMVFCGGFSWVIQCLMGKVGILFIIINCINMLEKVEEIFVVGYVDMVLMVCFFFVDVDFVQKVEENWVDEINICIVCNQVCFDYVFK